MKRTTLREDVTDDPRPTFGRCPACGGTVLLRQWREGAWIECQTPLSPLLGQPHQCPNALRNPKERPYERSE